MGTRTPWSDRLMQSYPDDMQVTQDKFEQVFDEISGAHVRDVVYRAVMTLPKGTRIRALRDVMNHIAMEDGKDG